MSFRHLPSVASRPRTLHGTQAAGDGALALVHPYMESKGNRMLLMSQ